MLFYFLILFLKIWRSSPICLRLLHASAVALLAFFMLHGLWWQNALLWSLCLLSPLTPLMDRLLPSSRFQWPGATPLERNPAPCVSVSSPVA